MNEKELNKKLKEIENMPWKNLGNDLKDSLALLFTILGITVVFFCTSCSTTVSIVNTHGKAEDVVDTEQKSEAEISPELSIPISAF